jgi:hypothetical protein
VVLATLHIVCHVAVAVAFSCHRKRHDTKFSIQQCRIGYFFMAWLPLVAALLLAYEDNDTIFPQAKEKLALGQAPPRNVATF